MSVVAAAGAASRPAWATAADKREPAAGGANTAASPPPAPATPVRGTRATRASRTPRTRESLGRLRRELAKIAPPPASPEEAHHGIVLALSRAGLGDWTLPPLGDAERGDDGSLRLRLLAHAIVFNAWGAFRIVDEHAPATPYFELPGAGRRAFRMPA